MALTVPPPVGWARWPQHHPNGDYVMVDPGTMSYTSRATTSDPPPQRPITSSAFFPSPPFTTAPMPSMTAPQYLPGLPPVTYGGYGSYTTSPVSASTFKQEQCQERPQLRPVSPCFEAYRECRYPRETRSPSIKSESQVSRTLSVSSCASTSPTTILSAPSLNQRRDAPPRGKIDSLMMVISKTMSQGSLSPTSESEHRQMSRAARSASRGQSRERKFVCQICGLRFNQNTHLGAHVRSHTGERPFSCDYCGETFTQTGNKKQHEKRHTGEKPFACDVPLCNKAFISKGQLRSHQESHTKKTPFSCKLDNCKKNFTQKGNLKSHQEKFHQPTIDALRFKWANAVLSDLPEEEKKLMLYLADLHKNSNKGIKGRGKHRKVARVTPLLPPVPAAVTTPATPYPFSPCHGLPQILHTRPPLHQPLQQHGMTQMVPYNTGRQPFVVNHGSRDNHGHYDMFGSDDETLSGSGASTVYDDHGRDLAFGDRVC